jgi:hypothetical protein
MLRLKETEEKLFSSKSRGRTWLVAGLVCP